MLDNTDVLFWWGHCAHGEVRDEIVDRIQKRIHSGHKSKIFMRMLGTTADLRWREIGERERVWVVEPSHPIAAGLPEYFELPHTEMYGERFDIPRPDDTVFITWYEGGEVFRSGVTFTRGNGRIFYFAPGHETFPIYFDPNVQKVLINAARWTAARVNVPAGCRKVDSPVIVKGLRQNGDYEAELGMALVNRHLAYVETMFLPANPVLEHISSSVVKDVARHGGDITGMVPDYVVPLLEKALR